MKAARFTEDASSGAVRQILFARAGIPTATFRAPSGGAKEWELAARVESLRDAFPEMLLVGGRGVPEGGRQLRVEPSLEAWLTRDAAANNAVLGPPEVPPPPLAQQWLRERLMGSELRRFSLAIDGRAGSGD